MYKVTLEKIESTHENVRTKETTGLIQKLPEIGETLELVSNSLDFEGGLRLIYTTPIKGVTPIRNNSMVIKTQNSTYAIKDIEEITDEQASSNFRD